MLNAVVIGAVVVFFVSWLGARSGGGTIALDRVVQSVRSTLLSRIDDEDIGAYAANRAPLITQGELRHVLFGLALFAAMIAGTVANYFWVHGFASHVDLEQFGRPILVSPIIFMSVYVAATKQPRGLVPILLAFQNGFFWQTVLEAVRR